EILLRDIPILHAFRCIVKSTEARWKVYGYQAEASRVTHKLHSILEKLKKRQELLKRREEHVDTIINNLILYQNLATDSITQDIKNFSAKDISGKLENNKNTQMFNKSDYIIKESNTEGLDVLEMAEWKNIFGDIAGAKRPSLSVLPIINVTLFSERDQDAGRWIAVLESKFVQAGFDSAEDIPGWMWVKAVWMNTTIDAAMLMDSTPHIRKITDKLKARRPSEISDLERDVFTDEFVRRFDLVVAPEIEPQQQKMMNELRQDKDESLRDYFFELKEF
ncbi:hypothetical protein GcM3_180047, partial [Golovinomyces cichoracearum]